MASPDHSTDNPLRGALKDHNVDSVDTIHMDLSAKRPTNLLHKQNHESYTTTASSNDRNSTWSSASPALQSPTSPATTFAPTPRESHIGKSPAGHGSENPFDDSYFVLEDPTPAHLDAVRLPKVDIRVVDPERRWRGQLKGPRPGITEEDEIIHSAQTAVPIGVLPPSVRVLPDGTECLPHDEPTLRQPKGRDAPAPLTFSTTQLPVKLRVQDPDGKLSTRGRRNIKWQKHAVQASQLGLNGFCIFVTWWWTQYYYILLPLITATVALNVAMIGSLIFNKLWRSISPETRTPMEEPESMVLLIPCYNETKEELERSLDSLVSQQNIEHHKQAIMVICDGKVRGPGMEKTTADYLLEDILTHKTSRKYIRGAYTAWDQQPMDVVLQRGTYQGLPYLCMVKQQNQGKRDGLIVVRSFLYNFNRRAENPATIFTRQFFNELADFLLEDANIDNVDHLIGMDADTVFDKDCISVLLEESRYPKTVGVCGYVAVDWMGQNWNLWKLYQSAEYTIAQALRRLHQSKVTHKVSCLPGCCQLLKICEETCGDFVLLDLFGYCPDVTDGLLKQIRATASEDRNHVCHMLSVRPNSQTRQALRAKAYTDVPASWSVFLSQRRRWTLGATSNDLLLVTAPGVQWFERILAAVNVETWFLNPFIFASFASFIKALTSKYAPSCEAYQPILTLPSRTLRNHSGLRLSYARANHLLPPHSCLAMQEMD